MILFFFLGGFLFPQIDGHTNLQERPPQAFVVDTKPHINDAHQEGP